VDGWKESLEKGLREVGFVLGKGETETSRREKECRCPKKLKSNSMVDP